VTVDAGFGPMRALDGHILLAHLAWHGIVKFDHALKWIADVVWTRRRLEQGGIECGAAAWPTNLPRRPVEFAAQIDALLAGTPPSSVDPHVRKIYREMDAGLRHKESRTIARLPRDASFTLYQMQMTGGLRAKA